MRRIIAIIGVCLLGAIGCHHVGGKCDCGPGAGDNTQYAPNPPVLVKTEAAPKVMPMPK